MDSASVMPCRILSVEDDPDTAEMLAAVLQLNGYEVVTADQARTALDLLVAERFDLLITDYMLPENDGAWLILNARAAGRALPAVLCTAHPAPPQLDGVVVIPKPLNLERFIVKIATLLEASSPEIAAKGSLPNDPADRPKRSFLEARERGDALSERSRVQIARAHDLCAKSDLLCERLAFRMANRDHTPNRRWRAFPAVPSIA